MQDVTKLAERVFNMPVAIGQPHNVSGLEVATDNPEYAAATGMLRYGFMSETRGREPALAGIFKLLFGKKKAIGE